MTGTSTTFGGEGVGFRDLLGNLAVEIRLGLGGAGISPFTGVAPALPVLLAGNPALAQQFYRGIFAFAGHRIECQPMRIFEMKPPSAGWADELSGFSWLSHLEAPGLALYRAFTRNLISSWAGQRRRTSFAASCRRLMSFSRHAGFVLAGAPAGFEPRFLRLVTRETRRLVNLAPRSPQDQLRQAIAVLTAALAFRGNSSLRNTALSATASLITSEILPDGGPAGRSPKTLLDLLADLVPLRAALEAQRIPLPHGLHAAMEQAIPMLRMLSHGDGGLAVFHGVERTDAAMMQAILDHDVVQGQPLSHAAHAGYCRMAQGQSVVIADCGAPAVCDSSLAFEFSQGTQRIVGSCGAPMNASPEWLAAARSAAAHSALQLDNDNQSRAEPSQASAELIETPHGMLVKARSSSRTSIHSREFFLASTGHDFRGEDRIEPALPDLPRRNFTIRFHLHPSVKASANRKGAAIILLLPNKDAWQFSARGGAMTLEDSVYLAGSGPRHSRQIVIRGSTESVQRVNWAFRKIERQVRHNEANGTSPPLPF